VRKGAVDPVDLPHEGWALHLGCELGATELKRNQIQHLRQAHAKKAEAIETIQKKMYCRQSTKRKRVLSG
jgi:hypothetical protein